MARSRTPPPSFVRRRRTMSGLVRSPLREPEASGSSSPTISLMKRKRRASYDQGTLDDQDVVAFRDEERTGRKTEKSASGLSARERLSLPSNQPAHGSSVDQAHETADRSREQFQASRAPNNNNFVSRPYVAPEKYRGGIIGFGPVYQSRVVFAPVTTPETFKQTRKPMSVRSPTRAQPSVPSRSLSPEIPIYVPDSIPRASLRAAENDILDEDGRKLVVGRRYYIGAPPPKLLPKTKSSALINQPKTPSKAQRSRPSLKEKEKTGTPIPNAEQSIDTTPDAVAPPSTHTPQGNTHSSVAPPGLDMFTLTVPDKENANLEWYLDVATLSFQTRGAEPSRNVDAPGDPILPTRNPPPTITPAQNPRKSSISYSDYEPVPIMPRSTHKATSRKPAERHRTLRASIDPPPVVLTSSSPRTHSTPRRRSFSVVPDSEDESEGVIDPPSADPQDNVPELLEDAPQVPSEADVPPTSEIDRDTTIEPDDKHVQLGIDLDDIDFESAPEYQSEQTLFGSLKEAFSQSANSQSHSLPQFIGCYCVLIDPTFPLDENIVSIMAEALPKYTDMVLRHDKAVAFSRNDAAKTVIGHFDCLCTSVAQDPSTSNPDDPTSCGGIISIAITDVQLGFKRAVKAVFAVRHPPALEP